MDRRRAISTRPASSEGVFRVLLLMAHQKQHFHRDLPNQPPSYGFPEIECWSHAAKSLTALSNNYSKPATIETIGRVNRLISVWPTDDTLPAEGIDAVKSLFKKLSPGLVDIRLAAEDEAK